MKNKIIYLCLFAAVWFSLQAQNEKLRIAVFDPTSSGIGIDEGTKTAVREIISSVFVNAGEYTIVERSLIERVMQEQKFSISGAVDDSQASEIGRLAGANKIVLSVIAQAGNNTMLSIKFVDVNSASVEKQKTQVTSANRLLDFVEPMTMELIREVAADLAIINQLAKQLQNSDQGDLNKLDEDSQLALIRALYNGQIEPQFEDELFQLTLLLAQKGNPEAQYYLGIMYSRGKGGIQQDDDEASMWLQKSADQGYEDAQTELAMLIPPNDNAIITPNIYNPAEMQSESLSIQKGATNTSTTFYAIGGISIAAGIAATIFLAKEYEKYGHAKKIIGKEYNLIYAGAGLAIGGFCIGKGIQLKKKQKAQPRNMSYHNNPSHLPSYCDNHLRLDLVATGNGAGLRLFF